MNTLYRCFAIICITTVAFASLRSASGATVGSRFDPDDYADDGALDVTSGTLFFDTDALTNSATGAGGFLVTNQSGNVVMAMFNFTNIGISNGVGVTVSGNRGLVLGSQGDITIGATLQTGLIGGAEHAAAAAVAPAAASC